MKIQVQGQNGKFYTVDLAKRTCTCTGFRQNGRCSHLNTAIDIYIGYWSQEKNSFKDIGKRTRWTSMSSFHKEARRRDIERGTMCARVFARTTGVKTVTNYCKTVLFEESRNLDYFFKLHKGELSDKEIVNLFIRSYKKWELPYFEDHFVQWCKGFERFYNGDRDRWDQFSITEAILKAQDPIDIYEIVWAYRFNRDLDAILTQAIYSRAIDEKNQRLIEYLQFKENKGEHYPFMVALELMINYWNTEANEYCDDVDLKKLDYVPNEPLYIHDVHTFKGKKEMLNTWDKILPNKPMPRTLDLRWSGCVLAVGWRFEKFKQYKRTEEDLLWEEVYYPPEIFDMAVLHDGGFYSTFYNELKMLGYNVPVMTGFDKSKTKKT